MKDQGGLLHMHIEKQTISDRVEESLLPTRILTHAHMHTLSTQSRGGKTPTKDTPSKLHILSLIVEQ